MRIPLYLETRDDVFLRFPMMPIDIAKGTKEFHSKGLIDTELIFWL